MPYWFDGNNLIGQAAATAAMDRQTRRAFLDRLAGYTTGRAGRFVVFFDGDDPEKRMPPRGIQVHYSAPLSTDEAILRRLKSVASAADIIVVTTDRGLTIACRDAGARTMNWEAFTQAMQARTGKRRQAGAENETVNLEEWTRFFGLDKNALE